MHISFHNTSIKDKTREDFIRNEQYKSTGKPYETKESFFYKNILVKVIPEKLKQIPFDDVMLTEKDCKEIEFPFQISYSRFYLKEITKLKVMLM